MGKNEMLVGKALAGGRRDKALLSVKFGGLRDPAGGSSASTRRPAATKNFLAHSLRVSASTTSTFIGRRDSIRRCRSRTPSGRSPNGEGGVRPLHRPIGGERRDDPRAAKVHPICDLQIEYSLLSRGPERHLSRADGARYRDTAYGVLSHGLLTGSKPESAGDYALHLPRFTGPNAERNQALVDALHADRRAEGRETGPLAVAWVRAKGVAQNVTVVPTIGARTRTSSKAASPGSR